MKRVIFIGIHNKPNMQPLDSKTKSGKVIDRVIEKLDGCDCIKTNLFPQETMPTSDEIHNEGLVGYIISKYYPYHKSDILVLLGAKVQKYFPYSDIVDPYIIKVKHPSIAMSKEGTERYIHFVLTAIKCPSLHT